MKAFLEETKYRPVILRSLALIDGVIFDRYLHKYHTQTSCPKQMSHTTILSPDNNCINECLNKAGYVLFACLANPTLYKVPFIFWNILLLSDV